MNRKCLKLFQLQFSNLFDNLTHKHRFCGWMDVKNPKIEDYHFISFQTDFDFNFSQASCILFREIIQKLFQDFFFYQFIFFYCFKILIFICNPFISSVYIRFVKILCLFEWFVDTVFFVSFISFFFHFSGFHHMSKRRKNTWNPWLLKLEENALKIELFEKTYNKATDVHKQVRWIWIWKRQR